MTIILLLEKQLNKCYNNTKFSSFNIITVNKHLTHIQLNLRHNKYLYTEKFPPILKQTSHMCTLT